MFKMNGNRKSNECSTSTPKRRRLGTGRIYRYPGDICHDNLITNSLKSKESSSKSPERLCESPLPCNQIEFLCSSKNSSCNDVPGSPDILDCSIDFSAKVFDKTFNTITQEHGGKDPKQVGSLEPSANEIQNEVLLETAMFDSYLFENHNNDISADSLVKCNELKQNLEDTFHAINTSISKLNNEFENHVNMFETKDSFLLDIKESSVLLEDKKSVEIINRNQNNDPFYGLPDLVKSLFKSLRNIEKFYDWQEECLNLDAIKERKNLIYSLPTSGGKTLVAEVLMLREVLMQKKNVLFILPFVALVQEKIWSLSPFAVQLDFLLEEYAAGKGHIPPKSRRTKRSIYIATIEKGLALVRSLIELDRLNEIGLIVVDELHLIGEEGRGATLEMLLATVLIAQKNIQIIGMSATIGNLPELATFLSASVYSREFRPVELTEWVKLGDRLHRLRWSDGRLEVEPDRVLKYDYSSAALALDPDLLGGLVSEVVPHHSVLVFCPTKRNCENVAKLLCSIQRKEMSVHRMPERLTLAAALRAEGGGGGGGGLPRLVAAGVAYHHAGLSNDERALLEAAFRAGVVSVLVCTSTLAAGVNLPARRVVVRAPRVARSALSLAHYRQMCGRAGRAGHTDAGESIIICSPQEWPSLLEVLSSGVNPADSSLHRNASSLVLSCLWLKLASTRAELRNVLAATLMAVQAERLNIDIKQVCDDAIRSLIESGAVDVKGSTHDSDASLIVRDNLYVSNNTPLCVGTLGIAAIKGCLDIETARQLLSDLGTASRHLVVKGSCHLLFLLTPKDAMGIRVDYRHYYNVYSNMDESCTQTANILGITEKNAIKMFTGKLITNVPETVIRRFYLALVLYDLWNQMPLAAVADKYQLSRGSVQSLMSSAASLAWSAARLAGSLPALWPFAALFSELAPRLAHCAAPEIVVLMELPGVRKARALQLSKAGFKRIEDIAKASVDNLVTAVSHLSKTAATHLVSAARMMLIEKVENLKAEAEDVMEDLKM